MCGRFTQHVARIGRADRLTQPALETKHLEPPGTLVLEDTRVCMHKPRVPTNCHNAKVINKPAHSALVSATPAATSIATRKLRTKDLSRTFSSIRLCSPSICRGTFVAMNN